MKPVYSTLAEHQRTEPWIHKDLVAELQRWREILTVEFKLDVPHIALAVDQLPSNCLGHFRPGHNGFGLKGEVSINSLHLMRDPWGIIGTLCHELLHAWQDLHGKPSRYHHNVEFRVKAASLGLIVDRRGYTEYVADSPFTRLLAKHGVEVPANLPPVPTHRVSGPSSKSTLKKWTCACGGVWVGRKTVRLQCLECTRLLTQV